MTTLDPADIVPLRILDARQHTWREGLRAGAAEGFVSLVLNIAVLAGLVHLAFPPIRLNAESRSIAVDLVPDVPQTGQEHGQGAGPSKAADGSPGAATSGVAGNPSVRAPNPVPPVDAAPAAPAEQPKQPESEPEPARDIPPVAPEIADPASTTEKPDKPAPLAQQAPASIDTGHDATPRLIQAPTDPAPAATQSEKNQAATAALEPAATPKPVETPPPPQPETLAASGPATEALPPPAATTDQPKPAPPESSEAKREAENTARLAAALPFAQSFAPDMHRAALAGSGNGDVAKYRGAVYATFRKADDLVDQARAKGLRGQAVIEFSVDERGNLTSARVAVSSGNPAVDETALAMIRRSAPYPPPPPGAQHTFSPAIRLGLDD